MRDLPTIRMAHGMSNEWVDRAGLRIMCGVVMDPGPVGDMLRAPDSRSGREWTAGRALDGPGNCVSGGLPGGRAPYVPDLNPRRYCIGVSCVEDVKHAVRTRERSLPSQLSRDEQIRIPRRPAGRPGILRTQCSALTNMGMFDMI